jgi:tRNA(Arg) A34 adenosine deaminase TadA
MTIDQQIRHLRHANTIARAAMQAGHHPFGALLVAADGRTVLLGQRNVDSVNHAEAVLARGQKKVEVHGPVPEVEVEVEIVALHRWFWKQR